MGKLRRIPATHVIARLSAESEPQPTTNAKCDTEEDFVDLLFSLEDLVQPAINGLRFHAWRSTVATRLFKRDSGVLAVFVGVFCIVSVQPWR